MSETEVTTEAGTTIDTAAATPAEPAKVGGKKVKETAPVEATAKKVTVKGIAVFPLTNLAGNDYNIGDGFEVEVEEGIATWLFESGVATAAE